MSSPRSSPPGRPAPASPRRSSARYPARRLAALAVVVALGLLLWRGAAALPAFRSDPTTPGPVATGGTADPAPPPPAPSAAPVPSPTPEPPPAPPPCSVDEILAPKARYRDWKRTPLDTEFRLLETYEPPDLVSVSEAGFSGPYLVRKLVVRDLAALREAAEAAGRPIDIIAGYRSYEQQSALFEKREEEVGEEAARKTARPGHSEHQLGTAVDFRRPGAKDVTERFGDSRPGRWLRENAHRFGFVLSYPKGKQGVTCYAYEPWHFRYVGPRLAAKVHRSGLSLREFLWATATGWRPASSTMARVP